MKFHELYMLLLDITEIIHITYYFANILFYIKTVITIIIQARKTTTNQLYAYSAYAYLLPFLVVGCIYCLDKFDAMYIGYAKG